MIMRRSTKISPLGNNRVMADKHATHIVNISL